MATAYENNLSCAVCLELYDDPRILPCGHSYCLKCLLDLQNKILNRGAIKCPICQTESNCEYDGKASYTKNYELNTLVQSFIMETETQDTPGETYLCDFCDPQKTAERACVECEMMYCEACFKTCHPMRGNLGKHKIVKADGDFKCRKDTKRDDRNMYCAECDICISVTEIGGHKKHDIVTLDEAHSIFKEKLEESIGDIDLMQLTLKSSMEKSKDILHLVEELFEEIELEVLRKKEELLNKLKSSIKAAEAAIDNAMSAISTQRELQSRADTISFIEGCQNILLRTSLKHDFNDVQLQLDKIDNLTCRNDCLIEEIRKLELSVVPETNGPAITNASTFIKGRRNNNAILEYTTVQNAESYNVFYKAKESTVNVVSTSDTSCVLNSVDVGETIELWVTAMVNGRESLPSASVVVPTVTLPSLQFDHQCAGEYIRVSTDGKKIATANHAAELLGVHYPQCKNKMHYPHVVLGNPRMTAGRLYWEVEAEHAAGKRCKFDFGVTSSATPADCDPGDDSTSWVVGLECDKAATTIVMWHESQDLHTEKIDVTSGHLTHRHGLLLDVDQRSLSVIDVKARCVYMYSRTWTHRTDLRLFSMVITSALCVWWTPTRSSACLYCRSLQLQSVEQLHPASGRPRRDAARSSTAILYSCSLMSSFTLHLVDPVEIQRAPLLPVSTSPV